MTKGNPLQMDCWNRVARPKSVMTVIRLLKQLNRIGVRILRGRISDLRVKYVHMFIHMYMYVFVHKYTRP